VGSSSDGSLRPSRVRAGSTGAVAGGEEDDADDTLNQLVTSILE
jgi:hypothetical protein